MDVFQKELLELRKKITVAMRAELLGPGSEISYPDAEHELISEYPSDRYSVGILYPQNVKFGDNDNLKEKLSKEEADAEAAEETVTDEVKHEQYTMHNDDAFDDDVNMAQQNKPSSIGLTFFVAGDIDNLKINVNYAKYKVADDK